MQTTVGRLTDGPFEWLLSHKKDDASDLSARLSWLCRSVCLPRCVKQSGISTSSSMCAKQTASGRLRSKRSKPWRLHYDFLKPQIFGLYYEKRKKTFPGFLTSMKTKACNLWFMITNCRFRLLPIVILMHKASSSRTICKITFFLFDVILKSNRQTAPTKGTTL